MREAVTEYKGAILSFLDDGSPICHTEFLGHPTKKWVRLPMSVKPSCRYSRPIMNTGRQRNTWHQLFTLRVIDHHQEKTNRWELRLSGVMKVSHGETS